jgi:tetratricopeptide (TPR) repeat protein
MAFPADGFSPERRSSFIQWGGPPEGLSNAGDSYKIQSQNQTLRGRRTLTKTNKAVKSRYQEALDAFTKAVEEFHKENNDNAEKLFADFLEKYSAEVELADRARVYSAICADKKKKTKSVLKTADDYLDQGIYLMNGGDRKDSLKHFEKAAQIAPKEARVHYMIAVNHMLAGEEKESLESLKEAVELDEFFAVLAQNESDFEPLWKDEEFKTITQG